MFGVTMEQIKPKNVYTTQELYEKIKDVPFEAGVPSLVKYGPAYVIAFPEQDRNNQVQIQADRKGKIYVQRSTQPIGLDKVAANILLDNLTGGLSSMSVLGGKKKKLCEQLVKKTAAQLREMDL